MKVLLSVSMVIGLLFAAGCSSGEGSFRQGYDFSKVEKIAVIDVLGDVQGEGVKNEISDFFVSELLKKGYSPIERAQVQNILKEQQFQASDVTTNEGIARAGRILNVPTALVINIPNFGDEMSMTAKMIDVEDGSILWVGSGTGRTGRLLSTIGGAAAGAAAGAAVSGEGSRTVGGIAGGVLGGVAGQALTPQKAEQARKVVTKICKSLPTRN
ncbi:MAG: CsgG/HfaB family protein [Planctomycetota bacterium]